LLWHIRPDKCERDGQFWERALHYEILKARLPINLFNYPAAIELLKLRSPTFFPGCTLQMKNRRDDFTRWIIGGDVSRTSQIVALIRAELDRPHSPGGDSQAQQRLCRGMRPTSASNRLRVNVVARTRFFDEQVLEAVSKGVRQIVICGAGYDDRALRFRTKNVRFFELDHPATQIDKARRLHDMNADTQELALVPVDFRHDDFVRLLRDSGHVTSQPTLFVAEGLLVYLDQQTGLRLLAGLRSIAAPGSTLATSLAITGEGADSNQVVATINTSRRTGRMEPWLTILAADAYSAFLNQAGWQIMRTSGSRELETGGNASRMQLVIAHPDSPGRKLETVIGAQ
jgi:methyltransferase (TIGR00027 family)